MEELLRKRVGGAGNILYTLFHIADGEYSWIRGIQGKPDIQVPFESYMTLHQIIWVSYPYGLETLGFNQFQPVLLEEVWVKGAA